MVESYLVSVIIPCYNHGKYLEECVLSVLTQSYPNWECIIVDDGSTDNTNQIAHKLCSSNSKIKYVWTPNSGVSNARNLGIKSSCGELILPLDADDKIASTYLEEVINHFINHPETTLVYCKTSFFGEFEKKWDIPKYNYEEFIWSDTIFVSAIFKREDYDKTAGYNPEFKDGFEDWDFWLTLLKKDSIVYRIEKELFFYRQKSESRNVSALKNRAALNKQIYNNHKDLYSSEIENIISLKQENMRLMNANSSLERIATSKAYKLGKFILYPISRVSSIIRRKK